MPYELLKNVKIWLLDSYCKSNSFQNESLFKPFCVKFCEQAFAANLEAQIGYALYSLTSYVFSENPIKYKTKIKGESEKQDKMDL